MPYPATHKSTTRERILESARGLFNCKGFDAVTIDEVMADAGLTRGGFYSHFRSKSDLFDATVASYHQLESVPPALGVTAHARAVAMIDWYLGDETLGDARQQCPLYALPADVSRLGDPPRHAYTVLVHRTRSLFLDALSGHADAGERADAILALLVGSMTMARTVADGGLQESLRRSARRAALAQLGE